MKRLITTILLLLSINIACAADRVVVFAASSAATLMDEIIALYDGNVVASYASSGVLAKQISAGAPANIFLSANQGWMDYLGNKATARRDWLGNELLLISSSDCKIEYKFTDELKLSPILKEKRLAIGDPDHVPAGIYAKEAFTKLNLWADVEPLLIRADNSRVVLTLVSRGEVPLGVVFASDLAAAKGTVTLLDTVPKYSDISYPIAVVKASAEAVKFYNFLQTPAVADIIRKHGFTPL
ncbi:MAG: molybdate ABC transporter substrate-binding protein [Deferribacteraceae bacterium]|jgi:molybdate transport system substrate-binding protein|nr:molybdate ABC transporter substrate-binding protein [Deferribacteraceae bacterium]